MNMDEYKVIEKYFDLINEKLGGDWFELSDDEIKTLFKVVKLYELIKPIGVELKGESSVRLITQEEVDAKTKKWGLK